MKPTNFFNRFLLWFEEQLDKFTDWYGHQLEWVLRHKLIFTGIILLLFAFTGLMMKQGIIGKELISTGDQGKFRLNLEFDKSTSIYLNDAVSQAIEQFILQQPEVATVFSNIGGPSTGIGSLGVGAANKTEFTVQLKPAKERDHIETEAFMKELREELHQQFPWKLNSEPRFFEGIIAGSITTSRRGNSGFGYDPVFQPDGLTVTFAEMDIQQKNQLSHRAIAVRKLAAFLSNSASS